MASLIHLIDGGFNHRCRYNLLRLLLSQLPVVSEYCFPSARWFLTADEILMWQGLVP